jgi:hypothetical protein
MERVRKIIRFVWNIIWTLVSIPAYFALVLPLLVIVLCEVAKLNSNVIKTLLEGLKKKAE